MGTDTYYGIDPGFYDDSDFIECDKCESLFDHNEYNSFTCSACEDTSGQEKEGE